MKARAGAAVKTGIHIEVTLAYYLGHVGPVGLDAAQLAGFALNAQWRGATAENVAAALVEMAEVGWVTMAGAPVEGGQRWRLADAAFEQDGSRSFLDALLAKRAARMVPSLSASRAALN